jgi:hypothetical protein
MGGEEDDVVINYAKGQLEPETLDQRLDPKMMQV